MHLVHGHLASMCHQCNKQQWHSSMGSSCDSCLDFHNKYLSVWCSEAQVFCQEHSHDLGQVHHSGAVHVLLCVVQRVPDLWEGSGNDMQHGDTCMCVGGRERKEEDNDDH